VEFRNKQLYRLLGIVPTLAALAYRQRVGREYNQPREGLGYT
jgi:citrate synthase